MGKSEPSAEALGLVIREIREERVPGMSQADLADAAGYGKGGAVSISRIERGIVRPQDARFSGIALALGVTPEQLLTQAADREARLSEQRGTPGASLRDQVAATRSRHERVNERVTERARQTQEHGESFNEVHDKVRDDFFMKFVSLAATIEGAPVPEDPNEDGLERTGRGNAKIRIEAMTAGIGSAISGAAAGGLAGAAAGGAAAYGAFTAAAMFGTASTGAAISGLTGVAATNATLAVLGGGTLAAGGAGIAGGTLLLTSMVAAPAAILAVAGFAVLRRQRTKKEDARLRAQLDHAEQALDESQDGYDTMVSVLERATKILGYAGVHGSHALTKWAKTLPPQPRVWDALDSNAQAQYRDFLRLAGCVLAVSSINVGALLTARPEAIEEMRVAIKDTLTEAEQTIESLV